MPELTLQTLDGVALTGRRNPAAGAVRSSVVLVHGFAGSKDDPQVVALAEGLAARGHDVISFDSRGHHASGGVCTLGDAEWLDVQAAVDDARRGDRPVVTVGASMGAIAVLRHAANVGDVAGVVAVSSPALWRLPLNGRAVFSTLLTRTWAGRKLAASRMKVRIDPLWANPQPPVVLAGRIRVPLAVVHGDSDRLIPSAAAGLLVSRAAGATRLDIVAGMRHAFDRTGLPAILTAVEWVLGADHGVRAQG